MEFQNIKCFFPDAHYVLCRLIVRGRVDVRLIVWGADVSDCSELYKLFCAGLIVQSGQRNLQRLLKE